MVFSTPQTKPMRQPMASDEEINIGLSVRKGNTTLLDAANKVLAGMTAEGFNRGQAGVIPHRAGLGGAGAGELGDAGTLGQGAVHFGDANEVEDGVLTVAMECAYAPYNWTQSDDSNGAVPIANNPGSYANGYDVAIRSRRRASARPPRSGAGRCHTTPCRSGRCRCR